MDSPKVVRASQLRPTPWRNGRGVTRDVAGRTGAGGDAEWLISLADLTEDADFSHFPHCDRIFTLVQGGPVDLIFGGGATMRCERLVPALFSGDVPTRCRLPNGPARAFNVFADRRRRRAGVLVQAISDGHAAAPLADVAAVHCVSGRIGVAGIASLEPGDTLVAGFGDGWRAEAAETAALVVLRA
jgi:hypothetical protein